MVYIAYFGESSALAKGQSTVTTTKVDSRLSPAAQALADRLPKKAKTAGGAVTAAAAPWRGTRPATRSPWRR